MPLYQDLQKLLTKAGLSSTEAILYLELLKEPAQNRWELVQRTGLNKNKVYRSYDRLNSMKIVEKDEEGYRALPLSKLVKNLKNSQKSTKRLITKLEKLSTFAKIPTESIDDVSIADTPEEIAEQFITMSQVSYETNFDFGDLEGLVPILGGIGVPFKFRKNRYKQNAKNIAICTTDGPYTSCMTRESDMRRFKSAIERLNIDFRGVKIVFSDTNDRVMFSYFSDPENPIAITINSPAVAAAQRLQFDQFYKNLKKF